MGSDRSVLSVEAWPKRPPQSFGGRILSVPETNGDTSTGMGVR
jgi:hypothetical protein